MYSSVDDIRRIFEENDIDNNAVISDSELIEIIKEVDALIDATLYRRYTTPFTDPPQIVKSISRYKSTARAMRDVQRGSNGALIKPEVVEYYEKQGSMTLEDLRTGRIEITGSRRLRMTATTI